jgi:TatD DNase family protein
VIDTHAHVEACADAPAAVLERARAAGVDRVLAVGSTVETCRAALAVASREQGVYAVLGIHPHQAAEQGGRLEEVRALLAHERAVAIGETGLDYFRSYAPRERQLALFEAELALAAELGKPVVVHTRAADTDTARLLQRFDGTVVLHCFSSPALLPLALTAGYYVSFAGNVTYPKAQELREAAVRVPADRILAETDSPYLAPQPCRGRPNEPANVVHTVAALARARGEGLDELVARIDANATQAFSLPPRVGAADRSAVA